MKGLKFFDCFYLYYQFFFDQEIQSVREGEFQVPVNERHLHLRTNLDSCTLELVSKTAFVRILQQPGTQGLMHANRMSNYKFC